MTDISPDTGTPAATPANAAPIAAPAPAIPSLLGGEAPVPDTGGADTSAPAGTDTTPATGEDSISGSDTTGGDTLASDTTPALSLDSYSTITLGEDVVPNEAILGEFKQLALDAKLDPNNAQKLVDLNTRLLQAQQEAQLSEFTRTQETWAKEVNALPEFTGAKREESLATIGKLFDEFGSPEIRPLLSATGLGNNPQFVQFILKVANTLSEGRPASTGGPASQPKGPRTYGQIAYGDNK